MHTLWVHCPPTPPSLWSPTVWCESTTRHLTLRNNIDEHDLAHRHSVVVLSYESHACALMLYQRKGSIW